MELHWQTWFPAPQKGHPEGLTLRHRLLTVACQACSCWQPCCLFLSFLQSHQSFTLLPHVIPSSAFRFPFNVGCNRAKVSGYSSFKRPRTDLAPRFAGSAQLGHPKPLTLVQIWATHEPCMLHTQDADFLLPGPTVFGSSSGMLLGSSAVTRSGYSAANR